MRSNENNQGMDQNKTLIAIATTFGEAVRGPVTATPVRRGLALCEVGGMERPMLLL